MKKLLAAACLGAFLASFAEAQTINFDDLKRPGKAVEKSWTLSGVPTEAQGYIGKFGGADDIRVAQHRASQAAASRYSAPPASTSSGSPSAKVGNFECTFVCNKYKSLISSDNSSEQTIKVSAGDKNSANVIGLKNAEQWCKNMGYNSLYSRWGKGSIFCH